jgi:antirestriction protein
MYNPQIYVVCLASYNEGHTHGEWLYASDYDLEEQIEKLLEASPVEDAEEWAIHDYEDMPNLGANPDLDRVIEIANAVEKHGEGFLVYIKHWNDVDKYEERHEGEFETELKFAWHYAEQSMEIPKELEKYIDYEAIANNLFSDGYVLHDGHVFNDN